MFDFMTIIRALGDENRLRILMALRSREMCVCQITGFLDLSPSTTSKHLSILRQARLIESRKRGKWVYYSAPGTESATLLARGAMEWVTRSLENSPTILEDQRRILAILEQEERFCSESERSSVRDVFHSLEIHSLTADEEDA